MTPTREEFDALEIRVSNLEQGVSTPSTPPPSNIISDEDYNTVLNSDLILATDLMESSRSGWNVPNKVDRWLTLYNITGEDRYKDAAIAMSDIIVNSTDKIKNIGNLLDTWSTKAYSKDNAHYIPNEVGVANFARTIALVETLRGNVTNIDLAFESIKTLDASKTSVSGQYRQNPTFNNVLEKVYKDVYNRDYLPLNMHSAIALALVHIYNAYKVHGETEKADEVFTNYLVPVDLYVRGLFKNRKHTDDTYYNWWLYWHGDSSTKADDWGHGAITMRYVAIAYKLTNLYSENAANKMKRTFEIFFKPNSGTKFPFRVDGESWTTTNKPKYYDRYFSSTYHQMMWVENPQVLLKSFQYMDDTNLVDTHSFVRRVLENS